MTFRSRVSSLPGTCLQPGTPPSQPATPPAFSPLPPPLMRAWPGAVALVEPCDSLGCRYQGQLEALYTALEERQKARLRALREGTSGTLAERVTQVRPQAEPARAVCGCGGLQGRAGCAVSPSSKRAAVSGRLWLISARMTLKRWLPGNANSQACSLRSWPHQASS